MRRLDWDGCANVRDLGGLPAGDGRRTRRGAVVRADAVDRLSAGGWAALRAHGVRTIVDLRNDDELRPDAARRPGDVTTIRLPLDGIEDEDFWARWIDRPEFGTPLYFGPHLERMPQRSVAVLQAIAHAPPGGVLFHCMRGHDRTGQVTMLVLDLVGVPADAIADDYGFDGPSPEATQLGLDVPAVIADTLRSAHEHLRAGGLTTADVEALNARLLD
jgi:protein-tyrosine phosphatase